MSTIMKVKKTLCHQTQRLFRPQRPPSGDWSNQQYFNFSKGPLQQRNRSSINWMSPSEQIPSLKELCSVFWRQYPKLNRLRAFVRTFPFFFWRKGTQIYTHAAFKVLYQLTYMKHTLTMQRLNESVEACKTALIRLGNQANERSPTSLYQSGADDIVWIYRSNG